MCPLMIPKPGPPIVIGMLACDVFHVFVVGLYTHT